VFLGAICESGLNLKQPNKLLNAIEAELKCDRIETRLRIIY